MSDRCPKCNSANVRVGNFLLGCCDCGWSYLNDSPCSTCGKPATGVAGANGHSIYSCDEHSLPLEERLRQLGELFAGQQVKN